MKIPLKQRKRVKNRDGNKCVLCWRKYQLHIHHHFDFSGTLKKEGVMGSNSPYQLTRDCDLVTLCSSCHAKIQKMAIRRRDAPIYKYITEYLARFLHNSEEKGDEDE